MTSASPWSPHQYSSLENCHRCLIFHQVFRIKTILLLESKQHGSFIHYSCWIRDKTWKLCHLYQASGWAKPWQNPCNRLISLTCLSTQSLVIVLVQPITRAPHSRWQLEILKSLPRRTRLASYPLILAAFSSVSLVSGCSCLTIARHLLCMRSRYRPRSFKSNTFAHLLLRATRFLGGQEISLWDRLWPTPEDWLMVRRIRVGILASRFPDPQEAQFKILNITHPLSEDPPHESHHTFV